MPDVAAGSDEGVLAAWLVEESARFDAAQTIAYVETPDELFSVEAGRPGVLVKTLVEPGTTVEPGTPIGILCEPSEQIEDLDSVLVELGMMDRERVAAAAPTPDPFPTPEPFPAFDSLSVVAELTQVDEGDAFANLAERARERAGEHRGSPEGEAGGPAHAAAVEEDALGRSSVVEEGARGRSPVVEEGALAPVSKPPDPQTIQHHYLRARVRVDRLAALSVRLERDQPESGVLDLVGRAVVAAHRQVPQLGVARLEHDGATTAGIPVTYPGRFGVEEAAAVVPTGQAAALAVGDVRDEPVIDAGAVVPGKVMVLTLSVRPGRVDDVVASRWLAVLVALLERPEWMVD